VESNCNKILFSVNLAFDSRTFVQMYWNFACTITRMMFHHLVAKKAVVQFM